MAAPSAIPSFRNTAYAAEHSFVSIESRIDARSESRQANDGGHTHCDEGKD